MKSIWILVLLFSSIATTGQIKDINIQNNYGAAGYDLVSYFDSKAQKGNEKYVVAYEGISYKFTSRDNAAEFENAPAKFLPQYGGWCAYAMATKGEKVKVNSKTFELRNGKLYLFYDAYFNNTFEEWIKEGPEELVVKADENWALILKSNE